ncbi:hypothetical protein L6452_01461 [Arctium lappa]|uniref:Uncharacterized protein n=1 Tax=Arctium lappa TaxID=4217 RepID=A0ACB9FG64_ARCLA|nr:hypothetical protein L6452_01461 [Arctium lappa]
MKRGARRRRRNRRNGQRSLRQHEPEVDHISQLPIDIILKIFNLLPLESLLTMSTVSKQFKHLRTHVPFLDFDQEEMEEKIMRDNICPINGEYHHGRLPIECHPYCAEVARTKFIRLVDEILRLHTGNKMNSFSLCIGYYKYNWDVPMVNSWVSFALTGNTEEVELRFDRKCVLNYVTSNGLRVSKTNMVSLYTLPCQLSPSKVLATLTLHACQFDASCLGTFESLRFLTLINVDLLDSRIEHWPPIFPMLSELYMDSCVLEDKFFVTDKVIKIESIYLCNCMTNTWMTFPINIALPNLMNFEFCGTYLEASSIREADKLTDVYIYIEYPTADRLQGNFLISLLLDLQSCQCLELNSWCIQVLASTQSSRWKYLVQLQSITKLTLGVFMIKQELPGICFLLRMCPSLQTLTLDLQCEVDRESEGFVPNAFEFQDDYWESQIMPFDCLRNSLKTINILGFTGQAMELHILKFLLQKAMVLETLHVRIDDPLRNTNTVRNLERASPHVHVVINCGELPI